MQTSIVFDAPVTLTNPYPPRPGSRQDRLRNARARKKLERLRDRKRLRKHVEEIWNVPDV